MKLKNTNFNKKMEEFAKSHGLPIIGTSDAHSFWQLNTTYSLIEAEKDVESVIASVKEGKVEIVTRPLIHKDFGKVAKCGLDVYPAPYWHGVYCK